MIKVEATYTKGSDIIEVIRKVPNEENIRKHLGEMLYAIETQTNDFETSNAYAYFELMVPEKLTSRRKKVKYEVNDVVLECAFSKSE